MPVDPRRAGGGSAEIRGAQRIADLERRLGQLERGSKGAVLATGIKEQTPAASFMALTTSLVDVPNCSVSLTAQVPTVSIISFGGYPGVSYSTTEQFVTVYLYVDGVQVTTPSAALYGLHATGTITSTVAANISQSWRVSLAAGTHTVKVRAKHSAAAASGTLMDSTLTYIQTRA